MSDLQALLYAIPKPAFLIDADDRISMANQSAVQTAGTELMGRHFFTAFRQPALLNAVSTIRRDGIARNARFTFFKDGAEHHFEALCSALGETAPHQVFVMLDDISEREQVSQMRRDFVANVSHELRTPLTSIIGFIETLQGTAKDDPAAQAQFLQIMGQEAGRMERLISDLLSLSRVEAEERRPPKGRVDLAALSSSVAQLFAPAATERAVTLELDLPDELIVAGDEDQLRQVVTNLVENAIKYGAASGRVRIRARKEVLMKDASQARAILEVADEGEGIDPLHIPRLTERFFRVDSHRSREVGGTGLGLAIVKHIVARHKGRLKIESEQGKGSVFSISLPALTQTKTFKINN